MVLQTITRSIKYLLKIPYTRMVPKTHPPFKTENIRGRHVLDMNKCTGCTMCQQVCPANAIDMVEVEGEWKQNPRKRFPRIDMHKCTFCGLCVEYCPFKALSMTNLTGFELYVRDKSKSFYNPTDLAKKPEKGEITVSKEKFFLNLEVIGLIKMRSAAKLTKEMVV